METHTCAPHARAAVRPPNRRVDDPDASSPLLCEVEAVLSMDAEEYSRLREDSLLAGQVVAEELVLDLCPLAAGESEETSCPCSVEPDVFSGAVAEASDEVVGHVAAGASGSCGPRTRTTRR